LHVNWDDENRKLREYFKASLVELEKARADVPGSTVSYGASNYPHDPDLWAADWRDVLPPSDPRRRMGPPIVRNGTARAYHSMQAAHSAIREAYGLPPEHPDPVDDGQEASADEDH
jgi:hypothetical protein